MGENMQLRRQVTQLENQHQSTLESHAVECRKLTAIANTALASLKESSFSKSISEEAVLALEKTVIKLKNTLSEKDDTIKDLKRELDKFREGDLKKLDELSESVEDEAYAISDRDEEKQ